MLRRKVKKIQTITKKILNSRWLGKLEEENCPLSLGDIKSHKRQWKTIIALNYAAADLVGAMVNCPAK